MLRLCLILSGLFFLVQLAQAHPPTGIVVDKQGTVYYTDLETIWKLEPSGKLSVLREGVSGRHVHELAIDKEGNLFGADLSYESEKWISSVWKMTPQGKLTYLVEPTNNPPRGASLFHDNAGNMYLADVDNRTKKQSVLLKRAPDGQVTVLAGGSYGYKDGKGTDAKFSGIGGMFIDDAGSIYLTDANAVRKVTNDGVVTTIAANLNRRTAEDGPMLFGKNDGIFAGLTVDLSRNVYVADAGNQRLLKVSQDGSVQVVYRGTEPYYPNGVTIDSSGTLYVLEVSNQTGKDALPPRVRKISANGESSILPDRSRSGFGPPTEFGTSSFRYRSISTYKVGMALGAVALIGIGAWGIVRSRRGQGPPS